MRYDDIIAEESSTVEEALNRIPQHEMDQRILRMRSAYQLSTRNEILPRDKWTKPEDVSFFM